MCAAGKTLRHRDGACGGRVAGRRDRRGCRRPALLASTPGPGGEPTRPATAREVKLHFPDGSATRTCQPGGAEREAGVKVPLGRGAWQRWHQQPIRAAPLRAAGSAFCSCGVCGPRGQSSYHSRSFECEAGGPRERAPPPCVCTKPGSLEQGLCAGPLVWGRACRTEAAGVIPGIVGGSASSAPSRAPSLPSVGQAEPGGRSRGSASRQLSWLHRICIRLLCNVFSAPPESRAVNI
ncbi:unnamed protein product [Rangifer tarandus platyrhynchus]|uniref:Uncharacterized protein n=2 Tax=Rangifer tarandus platyrhynchus TaxID=3082113 RepID=A0ABN8Z5Y2_RANTA|nr:unnamed protein product [Rangifer tarandus platyrhynchus]CAI9704029.1 unnamed protein product [Rangifer tarandus platyrhynchus]